MPSRRPGRIPFHRLILGGAVLGYGAPAGHQRRASTINHVE
jgi:hypothetical protein